MIIDKTLERPIALTVAGFDPSGGAGMLADIKTFEQCGVYGFGVCSALTYQNDVEFQGLTWLSVDEIARQLKPLFTRFRVGYAKIGIVENLKTAAAVIELLLEHRPDMKIVWDPILAASAGYIFHGEWELGAFREIASRCALITPNFEEIAALVPGKSPHEGAEELSRVVPVLLKGGHSPGEVVVDTLCLEGECYEYRTPRLPEALGASGKHGSGCVLAAAITAALARGEELPSACEHGRVYTQRFLRSGATRLGFHTEMGLSMSSTFFHGEKE
jgi:hydroxymethylpyrimidine/phosphomethylpyrimidine kinase